jgi:glutamate-1-semialdehyde 2,1-aminomutase
MQQLTARAGAHAELIKRARKVFGGGALSLWAIPDDATVVVARGLGSHVWDIDGREYIDFHLGSGPLLLGHCHPAIVAAVRRQIELGSTFHFMNEPVIWLAEHIIEAVPCAETVKFVSTGTEATFYALRLARAFTGRPKVLKFEGALHGGHDYAAQSTAPPRLSPYPHPIPDSAGIPEQAAQDVLISEFNDLERTTAIVDEHVEQLAAIIVEPLQRALVPEPGFLEGLRALCDRCGALLIFDEIVTGFRLAWGGAQERYGVVPDLATLGKAFAGGYPMAAVVGRRDVLNLTAPERRGRPDFVWISGTFNGNPVAAAAGLATLDQLQQPGVYERLHALGRRLREGLNALGRELGIPLEAIGDGPVVQAFFGPGPLRRYRDTLATDRPRRIAFGVELLRRGLLVNPGEKFYISLAHTDEDMDRALEICREALRVLQG